MGERGDSFMNPLEVSVPTKNMLGIPICAITMDQVLSLIDRTIAHHGHLHIGVVNAAKIVNIRRNEVLRDDVMSSDIIVADGTSVVWASRILGHPLPERVTGIDLMLGMFRRGNENRYRVYCLGATNDVLEKATARIVADYPKLKLVGRHNGYFTTEEEPAIADEIIAAKPDILLVAMSSPKKEKFMAHWSEKLDVPVCHGVGGSFDVMAGKVQRAPERWQRLGLEWLYRLLQEPRRLWRRYLVTNTIFCLLVFFELLQGTADRLNRNFKGP
jgi:N-acetylglucosaminyldiphosphoundecaprenol N-acetyl-beta-D-mannosaminyltransferase